MTKRTHNHRGETHRVFLNPSELNEIRQKVEREQWAADLLRRLQESISRDALEPAVPYETRQPYGNAQSYGRKARDIALVHVIEGDETYLDELVDLFRNEFRLEAMDEVLDAERPPGISELNASSVKHWHPSQWSYGLFRNGFFYAYDLTRDHQIWRKDGTGERVEQRFQEVLDVQKPMLATARGWGNTNTWYAATVATLGAMLGDEEAVDLAINGPLGYKSMLGMLQDRQFWPEPISYGHQYVKDVLTAIAEVARHTGRGNLYAWETTDGVSLKDMYDGFLNMLFANGRLAAHGDGSGTTPYPDSVPEDQRFTTWWKRGHELWNYTGNRDGNTFEIAYRAYRDPRYAWVLAQNPARDAWDHELWGYAGLTHGIPLEETQPPEATSGVWRAYGATLVRGDETDDYWNGDAPAVYMCTGHPQSHGHSDGANIVLNACGRNLYPDLQIKWNYQGRIDPETGENCNPTPYSKSRIAHNTVSVDCSDPGPSHLAQLGAVQRSGPMKAVTLMDVDLPLRRTIGVTPEYVFDRVCVGRLAGPEQKYEHTYDYHLHGLGLPELNGVGELTPYTTLGEEYGMGPIDTRSDAPENQWIRAGVSGSTDDQWWAIMREERPRDPERPRGVRIHVVGEPETQVITGNVPDYVSMDGWDATQPEDGSPGRLGLFVVRRQAVATEFIVIHQPFCGQAPAPLELSHEKDKLEVGRQDFHDVIDLKTWRCRRQES
jgi:hypothetical protein